MVNGMNIIPLFGGGGLADRTIDEKDYGVHYNYTDILLNNTDILLNGN